MKYSKFIPEVGDNCIIFYPSENFNGKITYIGKGVGCFIDNKTEKEYTFSTNSVTFKPAPESPKDILERYQEVHQFDKYQTGESVPRLIEENQIKLLEFMIQQGYERKTI